MVVKEKEISLVVYFFSRMYSRRWGIETSYRMKKAFRAKTTSKRYVVRLFYFMFSVLLYNLWILIDALVCLSLLGKATAKGLKHIITAKLFGTVMFGMGTEDPGG